jgi:hypothetical protein
MRILFVDYWTKGIHNFQRLLAAADVKAEYVLLHLGSYGDPATPRFEIIDGITCLDVAAFGGLNLREILRMLKPDVIVVLNIAGLFDRSISLASRALEIPLAFVQHGVWADPAQFNAICRNMDSERGLMDRFRAFPKFSRFIPWYAKECRGGALSPDLWRVLYQVGRTPAISRFYPILPEQVWPSLACVYAEVYAEMLIANVKTPRERILVAGNPELDPAARRRDHPRPRAAVVESLRSIGLNGDQSVVCFMDEALVEQRLFGWTEATRHEAIAELYRICHLAGNQLLVRPHPATAGAAVDALRSAFSGRPGIAITRTLSLVDTLECSDAVFGLMSTALETAIVLRKPILTPLWYMNGDAGFSSYLRLGAATSLAQPSEMEGAIHRAVHGKESPDTQQFVTHKMGPVDGNAASRIIASIMRLGSGSACQSTGKGVELTANLTHTGN